MTIVCPTVLSLDLFCPGHSAPSGRQGWIEEGHINRSVRQRLRYTIVNTRYLATE